MTKIFISQKMPAAAITDLQSFAAENNLKINYREKENPCSPSELLAGAKDASAIWCTLADRLDENLLHQCPDLKVIANYAVGFNNIDIAFAKKNNILVSNTPDVLTNATAELTVLVILNTLRKISEAQSTIRAGKWQYWSPTLFLGEELKNKTLGILGMGRIGSRVADICAKGFGAKIIYHNRQQKNHAEYQWVSLPELLSRSDIIAPLCPVTPETKNLFNEKTFLQMKQGCFFINCSRGELHDEKALIDLINSGHIQGAGLDVTNPEPPLKDALVLNHPQIFVSPHIGSASVKARSEMAFLCVQNIKAAIQRRPLITPV